MLVAPPVTASFYVPGSANGTVAVPMSIPKDPKLDGFKLSLQALGVKNGVLVASNGLQIQFCK